MDVTAFKDAVRDLTNGLLDGETSFALGVSGGPDSLAMLVLADRALRGMVTALTVDHGLRAEGAGEAKKVAGICASRGIPHYILPVKVQVQRGSLQAAAREARYAAMAQWCDINGVSYLLTAHHADDQAETLLMRMARGAGVSGMSGIRAARHIAGHNVRLLRPLLKVCKADLEAIVKSEGLAPVDDPSNRDAVYDRTHARALLAHADWLDPVRAAETASHLADGDAALDWVMHEAWAGRAEVSGEEVWLDTEGLPHEITRRLTIRTILTLVPDAQIEGRGVEIMIEWLQSGKTATFGGVKATPGKLWRFVVEPGRNAE